jgi:hypothetical protein
MVRAVLQVDRKAVSSKVVLGRSILFGVALMAVPTKPPDCFGLFKVLESRHIRAFSFRPHIQSKRSPQRRKITVEAL